MTLAELMALRANHLSKAKAIQDGALAADRDLSDDEVGKIQSFLDQADETKGKIDALEARTSISDRLSGGLKDLDAPRARKTAAGSDLAEPKVEDIKISHKFEGDPCKGYKSPKAFILEVMQVGQKIVSPSENLLSLVAPKAAAGSDEHGTHADPYGGFLVPQGFSPDFLTVENEPDITEGRTTMVPMQTPSVKIPARTDKVHTESVSGGLVVRRRAETDTSAASRMEMEQIDLASHMLMGSSYVTEELLTDSPMSFAAILAAGFSDEFRAKRLDEILNGTGVGQFEGVNVTPSKIEVAKETNQAADTIVYQNILKMRERVWGYRNAIWVANHNTMSQLAIMNLAVGTGGAPVFMTSAQADLPDMLLGRPLVFTEFAETLGDAGDILCLNLTQYLEGIYQPLQSAESIHVRFENHESTFKFWLRNAGKPWWRTALTPKKGSSLSPFVTLAARA